MLPVCVRVRCNGGGLRLRLPVDGPEMALSVPQAGTTAIGVATEHANTNVMALIMGNFTRMTRPCDTSNTLLAGPLEWNGTHSPLLSKRRPPLHCIVACLQPLVYKLVYDPCAPSRTGTR